MATSIDEKRKTNTNEQSEVKEARIIANYGDPGLDENYHFDILSRYLIVMIESAYRCPTNNKWNKMIAIVKRPEHLWVNAEGGRASSPTSQKRSDQIGNLSIGVAGSFSTNGVARIDKPYQIGEVIKIKKLAHPLVFGDDSFFRSEFTDNNFTYESWHSEGSTLPYFAGDTVKTNYLRAKTLFRPTSDQERYSFTLYKYQHEAFMLNLVLNDPSLTAYLTSVFGNTLPSSNSIYQADGGYVFKSNEYINLSAVDYEDINIGNKKRVATNECMPLIVTTPTTFPTPKTRAVGTIAYNPTYSPVLTSS
jgi:hypothetical protein